LLVDLEGRMVELRPRQGFVVPKGVVHRTRAPERTVILMVEGAGIVPTGDGDPPATAGPKVFLDRYAPSRP
jgi:mannose-6-phosphate isomerase-like protein (cupin superfamily)